MTTRQELPENIQRHMKVWRNGLGPFPQSYIDFHYKLARARLEELQKQFNFRVIEAQLQDDGWMDGMMSLTVILETRSGTVRRIRWHDSNQDFMCRCEGGGWGSMFSPEKTLA